MTWLSPRSSLLMTAFRGRVVVDVAAAADTLAGFAADDNESDDKGREEVRLSRKRKRLYASR